MLRARDGVRRAPRLVGRGAVPVALVTLVVLAAACGGTDRPSVAEWTPEWERTVAIVPERAELVEPFDATICETAVASLRDADEILTPAPDEILDDAVTVWLDHAHEAMFECGPPQRLDELYVELDRAEREIEELLSADGDA